MSDRFHDAKEQLLMQLRVCEKTLPTEGLVKALIQEFQTYVIAFECSDGLADQIARIHPTLRGRVRALVDAGFRITSAIRGLLSRIQYNAPAEELEGELTELIAWIRLHDERIAQALSTAAALAVDRITTGSV